MTESPADRYDIRVGGGVAGQFAVGRDNTVSRIDAGRDANQVTASEIASLRVEFERVRAMLPADDTVADHAREHLDELEEAVTNSEPDLTTMDYVRKWFVRKLPQLAGAVTGLIVHPIVGRLVQAAGDTLATEFRHRFGPDE
ncbi:hypothetical protein GFY24_33980 [Nocardia sp. SYP-A9097]|uniref:hypothetical protein n=1 Tax=Nocardia sp. SYP-A9097 TaxID=2663237 RepID=UPI00129BE925|nr:hypothetical protein [Nocardia sp. SYP-A9097]MRH92376.1 hypothetical protein [Nocardia sp. SYP-A9097]